MTRRAQIQNTFGFLLLVPTLFAAETQTLTKLKVAGVFGDHMVLQRDLPVPVWGWAEPDSQVKVSIDGQSATTTVDADGKWSVRLKAVAAGGPHELKVTGDSEVTFSDVHIGEVWVCSGQSNMAMTVARSQDFEAEKARANLPKIRMITINKHATPEIQKDCSGEWKVASSATVGSFSATAWFFGQKLHEELDVPIGLINSSWGGTDIASWTSHTAQQSNEQLAEKMSAYDKGAESYDADDAEAAYRKQLQKWEESGKKRNKPRKRTNPMVNQNRPSNLFNGMIHPVIPYGMRGAIWYQGERNSKSVENGQLYAAQLKLLITDWRTRWDLGDFPFITVQLPNFRAASKQPVQNTGWVALRESQMKSLRMKQTGIAITTDVGMEKDIHPKNKQAVGQRLAMWALGTTYGKDIVYSSPMFSSFQMTPAYTKKVGRIDLLFKHEGEGLKTTDGGKKFTGFAIAGEDKVFHKAKASINAKNGRFTVSSDQVEEPVAVRYNWSENPTGNVINSAGLPLAPFRTDSWELTP